MCFSPVSLFLKTISLHSSGNSSFHPKCHSVSGSLQGSQLPWCFQYQTYISPQWAMTGFSHNGQNPRPCLNAFCLVPSINAYCIRISPMIRLNKLFKMPCLILLYWKIQIFSAVEGKIRHKFFLTGHLNLWLIKNVVYPHQLAYDYSP